MGRDSRNLVYFRCCLNANAGIPEDVPTGNLFQKKPNNSSKEKEKAAALQLKRRICVVPKQHEQ